MINKIPTDAEIVRDFIAETEAYRATAKMHELGSAAEFRTEGQADAREALAARLEDAKMVREEARREALERVTVACAEATKAIKQAFAPLIASAKPKADDAKSED